MDVQAGETFTFTMVPDKGLMVQFRGNYSGTVAGDAFQRLFLRLYLGDKPPTENLREELVGNR